MTNNLTIGGVPVNADGRRNSLFSLFSLFAFVLAACHATMSAAKATAVKIKIRLTQGGAGAKFAHVAGFLLFSIAFMPKSAWAVDEESFGGMANNVVQQGGPAAKAVLVLALIGGLATVWAGGKKIIAASDSQGREPFGPGIVRIAIGGLLCVLSTFTLFASHSFTNGNTTSVSVGTVNGMEGGD